MHCTEKFSLDLLFYHFVIFFLPFVHAYKRLCALKDHPAVFEYLVRIARYNTELFFCFIVLTLR